MKKFKNIVVGILAGFAFAGCDHFLDIQPKGEVVNDKMFEDARGYMDAMYGIYASLASGDLYGKNLTWGFADQLAHLCYNPHAEVFGEDLVLKVQSYDYAYPEVEECINTIWSETYRVISYINNVLENIEKENLSKHPDLTLIKGEAYALRAFLHFDILRYFSANIQDNPEAGGIPYAYSFDLKNKELFSLKACYGNILKDLDVAQYYLAGDTVNVSTEYREARYNFLNLSAVYAIKARVFQAEGVQLDSARFYAEKVIASSLHRLISVPTELSEVKKYPGGIEIIWGLSTGKLYEPLYNQFLRYSATYFNWLRPRIDYEGIYKDVSWTADNHDYRWDHFFAMRSREGSADGVGDSQKSPCFVRFLNVNASDPKDVELQKENTKGVSLIRLPEMYYIAAEAVYEKDPQKALDYLNKVRRSRGLTIALDIAQVNTVEKFRQALQSERVKELWGEGQIFLDYKRTNASFMDYNNENKIVMTPEIAVLPWPDEEKEFGYTNK
ncbi:MAG: RagB/SusD family nutrient uptake outer membrane protein [Odoribacter sp.]|nr:RagB/SusD family nutrient uptake outer membrane protein [Odoribacter sp.]